MATNSIPWAPPFSMAPPPPLVLDLQKIPTDYPQWTPPPRGDVCWWPLNAAQQAALSSPAEVLLYGGASGGGKTDFLVGDAMQEYRNPAFRGLLLRETLGEFSQLGDRMEAAYLPLGAKYRGRTGGGEWRFPLYDAAGRPIIGSAGHGARIRFGYSAQDKDLSKYRGNPYTWLGIDESGLHPMHRVRAMFAWLVAPESSGLRVRARFASNPGGVGHGWEMAMFLRNRCPLHYPAGIRDDQPFNTSVRAGKVYAGAGWKWPPTPADLVHMTTAFFPADVTENPLYGETKINALRSQTPEIQMQLLHGCWCNAESLYFGFLRPEWMVPYSAVNDRWWWNHFISIDFGYMNSSAAAGRFSVDEYGRVFGTGELLERKMGAVAFARKIAKMWIEPQMGEERPRVLFVTMDPAMDSHSDTGQSIFDKMAAVFAEYGVVSIKSHKSPADNAQILYEGLTSRTMLLTDMMPQTFNSLSTRTIDERRAVKKLHGDPLDDLYDMVSYAYNTWLVEAVKPERMKLQEKVNQMRAEGVDATTIARYSLQETSRINAQEATRAKGLLIGGKKIGGLRVPKG